MTYYIGQIFIGEYPADCANWCNNKGTCHIEEIEPLDGKRRFEIVENPPIPPIDVNQLRMTPLDFIKAIETLGVSYKQIKALCDANEEVDKELRFCNHVYRGNPLLDKLCSQFGIIPKQLDDLFKEYGE